MAYSKFKGMLPVLGITEKTIPGNDVNLFVWISYDLFIQATEINEAHVQVPLIFWVSSLLICTFLALFESEQSYSFSAT